MVYKLNNQQQINTSRFNSTIAISNTAKELHPFFVTGFADGESTFYLGISKSSRSKVGWSIIPSFSIELHEKDTELLNRIKTFFSAGKIRVRSRARGPGGQIVYSVSSIEELSKVIIPHFDKYPLVTQKRGDFELFKLALDILNSKKHRTLEGINQLVAIKSAMNKGLSDKLKSEFSVKPYPRPLSELPEQLLDCNWIAGFTDAEGCFHLQINNSKTTLTGASAGLKFRIGLHSRDSLVLTKLREQLGCGNLWEDSKNHAFSFSVTKFTDIVGLIIPIFNKYPLQGSKKLDFYDFVAIANIMEKKEHLTLGGLEKIRQIKSGMNTGRNYTESGNITTYSKESRIYTSSTTKIQKRSFHVRVKPAKRIGPHNKDVISVIVGSLLGNSKVERSVDGTRLCYRQRGCRPAEGRPFLRLAGTSAHPQWVGGIRVLLACHGSCPRCPLYLYWLYDFFYTRGYCTQIEPRMYTRILKKGAQEKKTLWIWIQYFYI